MTPNQISQSGFYFTPLSKCLVGWVGISHISLQMPILHWLQKYLVCRIPDSLTKGEFWRIFTSGLGFLETKNAVLTGLLIYNFRIFERRWGTCKLFSHLLVSSFLSTLIQIFLTYLVSRYLADEAYFDGFLCMGPIPMVFSLFVPYYYDIPKMRAPNDGGFATSFISSKSFVYFAGFHLLTTSSLNAIAGISGLISGLILRKNLLWCREWCPIPKSIANATYRFFGQWISSGPPSSDSAIGATLDIQRGQQADAIEQQIARLRTRRFERHRHPNERAQIGQGFAERLVDDHSGFQNAQEAHNRRGVWNGFELPNAFAERVPPPAAAAASSEENIRLLMDMGFSRQRVETALRQSNDDIQLATTVLLQEQ